MATTERIMSAEQLLRSPDLGRCELVRGELVTMTPAGFEHGNVALAVGAAIRDFVHRRRLGVVTAAETGYLIESDPDTVRAPDVAFVRAERIPAEKPKGFFPGAPDLAVEVLSPDDRASEVNDKVQQWLETGCRAVWVVDPKTRSVSVYRGPKDIEIVDLAGTLDGGDILPGFALPVAEIFA